MIIYPRSYPGSLVTSLIFNKGVKSYRDLPLRYGEFGSCHRNEPSGALHGLMRIRGFTQDDGHIFCTEDQILPECVEYTALLQRVYAEFGFGEIIYKVATRITSYNVCYTKLLRSARSRCRCGIRSA